MREYVLRSRPVMLEDCLGAETRAALEKVTTGRFIRSSAVNDPSVSQSVFTIMEKAPTRSFSRLKAPTSTFTFKTLLT